MFKTMINVILIGSIIFFLSSCTAPKSSMSNFVAIMQVDEPIEGACNSDAIYTLFPAFGDNQVKAKNETTEAELNERLNTEVAFLKDKPDYSDEGMVGLVVNCKGELVQTRTSKATKSEELDKQILTVFEILKEWTPGKLNGENVDSSILYSFTITDGKIKLN